MSPRDGGGAPGTSRVVAVVLAAGAGRRFGRPKACVLFEGEPLARRAARTALAACDAVVVVTGPEGEAVAQSLADLPATVAPNPDHATGMASSIRVGVRAALALAPPADAVLILPCDLPRVDSSALIRIVRAHREHHAALVASAFADTVGPPALFAAPHLDALLTLEGDRGARPLLESSGAALHRIPTPEAALDVDTPEDLERV